MQVSRGTVPAVRVGGRDYDLFEVLPDGRVAWAAMMMAAREGQVSRTHADDIAARLPAQRLADISAALGINLRMLQRHVAAGQVPTTRRGREYLISGPDLLDYVLHRRDKPGPRPGTKRPPRNWA